MYNALPLFSVQVSFNIISISLYNLFLLHFFLLFCQKTILFIKWFLAHLEWFFGLFKSHVYYIVIRFADAYADGINKMCYSQIRRQKRNTQMNSFYYYDYFANILITKPNKISKQLKYSKKCVLWNVYFYLTFAHKPHIKPAFNIQTLNMCIHLFWLLSFSLT